VGVSEEHLVVLVFNIPMLKENERSIFSFVDNIMKYLRNGILLWVKVKFNRVLG